MKYLICLALFASAACAASLDYQEDADIVAAHDEDRSFFFRFLDELLFDEDYSQVEQSSVKVISCPKRG